MPNLVERVGPPYEECPPAFPIQRPSFPEVAGATAPRRRRLLIVEDDGATLDVLRRLFQRMGWEVLCSMTVAGGLILLQSRPDFAILDLNLPDGDGATILAAIREMGMATRVVVASGTGDERHLDRVERMGPERLLRKPIRAEELFQAFGVEG